MSEEENNSKTTLKSFPSFSVTQIIPGGEAGLGLTSAFTPLQPGRVPDQTQTVTSTTTVLALQTYAGILPPAHELAKYSSEERTWILTEAKLNSEHTRFIEKQSLKIMANDENLHRIIPALIIVCFLISSTIIAVFASAAWGSAGIGLVLVSMAGVYFKGQPRSNRDKNLNHPTDTSEKAQSTEVESET